MDCKTCSGPTEKECLDCHSNFFDSLEKKCVDVCPNGYYGDKINNVCGKCDNCKFCNENNPSMCIECFGELFLLNNKCIKDCGNSYFKNNKNNTCVNCDKTCYNCEGPEKN